MGDAFAGAFGNMQVFVVNAPPSPVHVLFTDPLFATKMMGKRLC